jgi:LysR family transcriptional regulator, glycine cleavage system transcriptional activator
MSFRLAGLASLRVFEAAARHLSFTRAAGELGLTPAAVSSQIRVLERQVGAPLFWRTSRNMRLTRQGVILIGAVTEALLIVDEAAARIASSSSGSRTLTVTTSPSFAAKWLVPRLQRFREACAEIDVRIHVSEQLVDFSQDDADVAIRFGNGSYPGMRSERLFGESVFPVCAPLLQQGDNPLMRPSDLRHHTLIHLDWQAQFDAWPDWRMWLLAAGVDGVDHTRGVHFSLTSLALQAAVDGQGVALGNTSLVGDDLAAGRLVKPFSFALELGPNFAYHLIAPQRSADEPIIKAFRDWVFSEIDQETLAVGSRQF